MFKVYALLVDALTKIRIWINKVITGKKESGRNPIKDASFDMLILADQLYRS